MLRICGISNGSGLSGDKGVTCSQSKSTYVNAVRNINTGCSTDIMVLSDFCHVTANKGVRQSHAIPSTLFAKTLNEREIEGVIQHIYLSQLIRPNELSCGERTRRDRTAWTVFNNN